MKKIIFKDVPVLIVLFFVATTQVSCYQKFYKVADNSSDRTVDSVVQKTGKYFILRSGRNAFSMSDITLTDSNQALTCTLHKVENIHTVYLNYDPENSMIYKASKGEDVVLNEVHIYIPADSSLHYGGKYTIDLKKITKVEILGKDQKKTSNNATWSTIGIAVGVAAIAVTIYLVAVNSFTGVGLFSGPL